MTGFRRPRPLFVLSFCAFPLIALVLGARGMSSFENTPGPMRSAPKHWPLWAALDRPRNRPELLVFAHPLCGCSVATLHEIEGINVGSRFHTTVVFSGLPEQESRSSALWKQASGMSDTRAVFDRDGHEARRFGALTSGFAVLYNVRGELLFSGGVTASRGHEGDNYGLDRLISAIRSGRAETDGGFVFGCALFNREEKL